MSKQALYAMQFFMNRGYSPVAAAGIVGNLDHESAGLNPNIGGDPDRQGRMRATGIAQWWPDRWAKLTSWANKQGMNPRSLDTQLGYVDYELRSMPQVYAQVQGAKTVRDATSAFGLGFERPKGAETGVAENMHGWGSRLGRAVNFASLATGKPMAEFAASGWKPTDTPGAPVQEAAAGGGDTYLDLGAPPEASLPEADTSLASAETNSGLPGSDPTDMSDLYDIGGGGDMGGEMLSDPVSQKVATADQQRKMGLKPEMGEMNLADVFQPQNVALQKIGTAKDMPSLRKMSVG